MVLMEVAEVPGGTDGGFLSRPAAELAGSHRRARAAVLVREVPADGLG
jgi:hypothetical protein